jgi:hypothetical protein
VKKLALVLLIAVVPFLLAFRFLQVTDWGDLAGVLAAVAAGPLALYLAGKGLAYLFEIIPGWGINVPGWAKGPIVLAVSIGLMFGADFALSQITVIAMIAPYYRRVIEVVLLFLGSQVGYANLTAAGLRQARTPV